MDLNDDVGDESVSALLRERRPDLAGLELRRVGRGWDNGADDALPRRAVRALPAGGPGRSSRGCTGISGDRAQIVDESSVRTLAEFLRALHGRELPEAGGCEPSRRVLRNGGCEFGDDLISAIGEDRVRELEKVWRDALSAGEWDGAPVWAHNDLHPANVVVTDGALSGVIDFGEFAPGDPAIELAAAWTLLPAGSAAAFLQLYGDVDDVTVRRARGWAVHFGVFVLAMALKGRRGLPGGKPGWLPAGRKMLERILGAC